MASCTFTVSGKVGLTEQQLDKQLPLLPNSLETLNQDLIDNQQALSIIKS